MIPPMRGRHHNVFYYFRGPSAAAGSSRGDEETRHRQVEDNTTKALINVLDCGLAEITEGFLERFVPKASRKGIAGAEFYLQRAVRRPRLPMSGCSVFPSSVSSSQRRRRYESRMPAAVGSTPLSTYRAARWSASR